MSVPHFPAHSFPKFASARVTGEQSQLMKPPLHAGSEPYRGIGIATPFEAFEEVCAWQMLMSLNWLMCKLLVVWREELKYFANILQCKRFSGRLSLFIGEDFLSHRKVASHMKTACHLT